MGIEDGSGAPIERATGTLELPRKFAEQFLSGTLAVDAPLVREDSKNSMWRCFEKEVDVPNLGKTLLRVDYRQHDSRTMLFGQPQHFDQVRFDYVAPETDSNAEHPLIAEMHWYIEKGESQNPYPFDLMMVHRYVKPEYRNRRSVGKSLYQQAEAWAQQVADTKGENLVLALSTDQPLTMKWAEGLGYAPYPEEEERYREAMEHPERFELVTETDRMEQLRNPALRRDGKGHRIWFRKTLVAKSGTKES